MIAPGSPCSDGAALFDAVPAMCDVIGASGTILACNRAQDEATGHAGHGLAGRPLREVYASESAALLEAELARAGDGDLGARSDVRLQLRCRDTGLIDVTGSLVRERADDGSALLRTAKIVQPAALLRIDRLRREHDVLRGILEAARDACWCIEYEEPVDLTAPEPDILRQFFENVSYWRLCNDAMARLYKLPAGLDFNEQSVRFYFPQSGANEEFVRQLIAAGFNLDNAPSVDQRHDGSVMYAENDVRADIRDGRLYRMWGTVRDVSAFKQAEQELARQVDAMRDVLSALPDPILVVDAAGIIEAANPALESSLGWDIDAVLGAPFDRVVRLEGGFLATAAQLRRSRASILAAVELADGREGGRAGEIHLAPLGDDGDALRVVATLRLGPQAARLAAT